MEFSVIDTQPLHNRLPTCVRKMKSDVAREASTKLLPASAHGFLHVSILLVEVRATVLPMRRFFVWA